MIGMFSNATPTGRRDNFDLLTFGLFTSLVEAEPRL
jgi:hypothetical protein